MKANKSGILKFLSSFGYAFQGIFAFFKSGTNAIIHLVAAVIVIIAGYLFHITSTEWCLVVVAIGIVMSSEAINTSVEKLANQMFPEYNEQAKLIKDIAAGAVLICAIAAFIIGLIIFLPKF